MTEQETEIKRKALTPNCTKEEEDRMIIYLLSQSCSSESIGKKIGRSKSYVCEKIRKMNSKGIITRVLKPYHYIDTVTYSIRCADVGKMKALFSAGWSMDKVCDEFNATEEDIKRLLDNYRAGLIKERPNYW